MDTQWELAAIDQRMRAVGQGRWHVEDDALTGEAEARTDLFVDPVDGTETLNAPRQLLTPPDGAFQLSARVDVRFAGTYDAAALLLWSDEHTWAKLCFEFSPQSEPMVVSVVTRGVSDDANGFKVAGSSVWLRVSRLHHDGVDGYAYHASTDGSDWQFVRQFSLGDRDVRPDVGFEVQAPMGERCDATFSHISLTATTLTDLRDGS